MEDLTQKLQQLNQFVASYDYEKTFDLFYDESLLDYENEHQSAGNLQKHKEDMQHFLASISNKTATAVGTLVSDDITVTDWHYVFDHSQWGHRDFHEITVQRWKNGKIIHERHPYKEGNSVLVSGFLICKSGSLEEVREWSKTCPILKYPNSSVEIRPLIPFPSG